MSEPTPESTPTAPAQEPTSEPTNEAPPWGDDFDPARAWKTIQNLREREKELSKVVPLTGEQQKQLDEYNQLVEASKSEAQRKDEAAASAQRERDEAKAEAARYKIAMRHGLAEDDFDLLGSGSEEQIEARAQKIAAKNEAAKQAALDAAVQTPISPEPRRPTPNLRPGASPSPDPVQDDTYYPSDWLSPTQRAHVERARNNS